MIKSENKITQFQLFFIVIQSQIGIGVISLPYNVSKISKGDAWISILVAGICISINIFLIWLLYRRFPSLTIFEMLSEIVGKHIAFLLKITYIVYFFSASTWLILLFRRMVNIWILPRTPLWVVSFIMIAVCLYCARENLKVIARFDIVVSFLLVVLFLFITYVIKDINYLYILPVGESGFPAIIKSAMQTTTSFFGFELLLVVFPYCLGKNAGKIKVALMANGFVTFFYAYLTFVSLTYFGLSAIKFIPEPILYIMKFHSFQIIERTDLLFFSIWIVSVATSFMMYLYLASNGLACLFRETNHSTFAFYTASLIFVLLLFLPNNENVISVFNKYYSLASFFLVFVLPCILLFVSVVRGKKEAPGAARS
ncbi:endospore germination permease [Bacillus thuringiensis]|nr:endospore germination permease [Bacillus thuringiensis]MED3632978.1 endospore germination permease [Bacillus thuringiensis]